ncbi:MAG: NADH-quinone oxidoreductase subunit NuoE [Hyphomicrobium sp.]|nr:NADH-quinone oxidoreductase subunit NuoE [Hyphomicrobium sp.]PPC81364.1 MAG: NADH-quinone oxidoreductase subunit NuoE [Hyphomicrobium sp.]
MAVRRLDPEQPPRFDFTPENAAWAQATIANYPPGKQASAVIPLLWRAQEQNGGWTSEPAMRVIADMLGMAYIRVYEIATFYTMFQLSPVGKVAHVQVCGTTPCMLRGSGALIEVCKNRIAEQSHELSADGKFSWEEVECLGSCANAPMVEIWSDTYEDLTAESFSALLDGFAKGKPPKPGSQTGRTASCPAGGPTTLTDPTLYDGSGVGAWQKRFMEAAATAAPAPAAPPSAAAAPKPPQINPGVAALIANSGLVPELQARGSAGGAAMPVKDLEALKAQAKAGLLPGAQMPPIAAAPPASGDVVPEKPTLLAAPRDGKADELGLIWGVADKLEAKMNALGVWHFDQIAAWTPAHVAWFEHAMEGFKGRIARDKWIEQCKKLAAGWRPEGSVGERPKG